MGQAIMRSKEMPSKMLIFHGIILRSQLIALLKNHIFFEETDGVSVRVLLFLILLHEKSVLHSAFVVHHYAGMSPSQLQLMSILDALHTTLTFPHLLLIFCSP